MRKLEIVLWVSLLSIGLAAILPNLLGPAGLARPRLVALQDAQGSCRDDSGNIYVDCGNGTVTDNRTGLVWLKDAGCLDSASVSFVGPLSIAAALSDLSASSTLADADCGLADGSAPGEWRLPSASEWEEMTQDAVELGCTGVSGPAITNDEGTDCWQSGNGSLSFVGVQNSFYWSATLSSASHYGYHLSSAMLTTAFDFNARVWPVRRGQ